MNKFLFGTLLLIMITSCSPKMGSSILKTLPALPNSEVVIVLNELDEQLITAEKIGEIKVTDNGFSSDCSYYENIQNLKRLARAAGANLVKITEHKSGDKWSSCDRFWADIYKVDNAIDFEVEIEWSENRKLTWDDFKGVPNSVDLPEAAAATNSGFGSYSNRPHMLETKGEFFVVTKFYKNTSWVISDKKSDYILNHEQLHFDLAEVYSRKYRKALQAAKLELRNMQQAETIFNRVYSDFVKRQERYDNETEHGINTVKQGEWNAIIEIELAKYDLYKKPNQKI